MLRNPGSVFERWARLVGTLLNVKSDKLRLHTIEGLPQWPVKDALGVELTENEVISALRSMTNAKAMGPNELVVELFKLMLNHDPSVLQEFRRMARLVWRLRKVAQRRDMS